MPAESHLLMDGALHVYRREGSRFWQCANLGSRNHRQTTKEETGECILEIDVRGKPASLTARKKSAKATT